MQVLPQTLKQTETQHRRTDDLAWEGSQFGVELRLADQHPAPRVPGGSGKLRFRDLMRLFQNQQVKDRRDAGPPDETGETPVHGAEVVAAITLAQSASFSGSERNPSSTVCDHC